MKAAAQAAREAGRTDLPPTLNADIEVTARAVDGLIPMYDALANIANGGPADESREMAEAALGLAGEAGRRVESQMDQARRQIAAAIADPGVAALATEVAALYYGLKVVRRNMEDGKDNATRFWVLGHDLVPEATGGDKTTILFDVENQPGSLVAVLNLFSSRGLNATMLQSRPSRLDRGAGLWEYTFFAEFLGHILDSGLAEAFSEAQTGVGSICKRIRLLGSYPRNSLGESAWTS